MIKKDGYMKNKAVIVNISEIGIAGELCCGKLVDNGIVIKLSDKSNIKMWVPVEEIAKIILLDATEVSGMNIPNIFTILDEFSIKYELEV